jgi:hypothetical protein
MAPRLVASEYDPIIERARERLLADAWIEQRYRELLVEGKPKSRALLEAIIDDPNQPLSVRRAAARDLEDHDMPKLGVSVNIADDGSFVARLEAAIARSNGQKVIERSPPKVIEPPQRARAQHSRSTVSHTATPTSLTHRGIWNPGGVTLKPTGSASRSPGAPDSRAANIAASGSTDANTINSVHSRSTSLPDQRNRVVGLRRRKRHGLCRDCQQGRCKGSSDQFRHVFLRCQNGPWLAGDWVRARTDLSMERLNPRNRPSVKNDSS